MVLKSLDSSIPLDILRLNVPPDVFATDYLNPLVLATKSLKRLTQSIDWDVRRRFLKLAAQSKYIVFKENGPWESRGKKGEESKWDEMKQMRE